MGDNSALLVELEYEQAAELLFLRGTAAQEVCNNVAFSAGRALALRLTARLPANDKLLVPKARRRDGPAITDHALR